MQFFGTNAIQTSTASQELVQLTAPYTAYSKFSFMNDQSCQIQINTSSAIYLRAAQGFDTDRHDYHIYSFIIVTAGITYNFIAEVE